MRNIGLFLLVGFLAVGSTAAPGGAHGVWRTEKNDEGAHLEVTVAPCESDATLTCGTISKAFTKAGEDPNYADLGKSMVEGMKDEGNGSYSGGTIWDPENGKTYKSKMTLKGDELDVDGCISVFCEGQHWQRVAQ
jgi:uncharacterized protein (DUF2147 family)